MNILQNPVFLARVKSLAWRVGGWFVVGGLGMVLNNVASLGLTPTELTLATFVLNEVTKFVNDKIA